MARDNQLLPGDWRQLGTGDLRRIGATVVHWTQGTPTLSTLEACLMVYALITTGRSFDQLAQLSMRSVSRGASVANMDPGLVMREGKWSWWLRAGGPDRKVVHSTDGMLKTCRNVWLPVSTTVDGLVRRCLRKRGLFAHAGMQALFVTPPPALRGRVLAILTARPRGAPKARRSATTVESAERWLLRSIAQDAGGEIGAASLITGRRQTLARPMTHYGALRMDRAIRIHRDATARIEKHRHNEFPPELAPLGIGDPETPSDEAVQALIDGLASNLVRPSDPTAAHLAMMRYTCALLAYALALRGPGHLPGIRAIDARTGFCQMHDKDFGKPTAARLLWVPAIAREQLRLYDDHILQLCERVGIAARDRLLEMRAERDGRAPLFVMRGRFRVEDLSLQSVLLNMRDVGWVGRENAGRHWLRRQLSGQCSGETLGAYFGHWQAGVEPWGTTSALDPLAYRADLERCLGPILERVGWRPLASPLA